MGVRTESTFDIGVAQACQLCPLVGPSIVVTIGTILPGGLKMIRVTAAEHRLSVMETDDGTGVKAKQRRYISRVLESSRSANKCCSRVSR